ncbi:MAG: glycerol kinase GlpK [Oscillospiraceae bacterium]|nr:glycerol kinase GlpK [Oscillospiraceae bacterium]
MILSIDQSTSATKAFLFDESAKIINKVSIPHEQFYPKEGYVEHDAEEIYLNTLKAIIILSKEAINIKAISITNQRETIVLWDKISGTPIYNAIVWQDNRGSKICEDIEKLGYSHIIKEKTGLTLSPFFSASKISWILKNVPIAKELLSKNRLLCGTMDSFLIYRLSHNKKHLTDFSNASRTQLFNIHTLEWDEEILDLFEIPKEILPEVKFSDEIFGYFNKIPITGVLGDSHAALFGQNCFNPGDIKATYGTGSSIMLNIGERPLLNKNGIVTSIGFGFRNKISYVFEGNINSTGATIKWLSENLEMMKIEEAESLASSVDSNLGVYLVPSFTGLGAPYWDNDAKAIITGLTFGANKKHIVRAGLESIAYQVKDCLDAMISSLGFTLKEIRVDGEPCKNKFLMQFQSDILNAIVSVNNTSETSALGSAFIAGLAVGMWNDLSDVENLTSVKTKYFPSMDEKKIYKLCTGWKEAIVKARGK